MNETFEGFEGEGANAGAAPVADPAARRTPEEEFLAAMLAGRDVSDLVDPAAVQAAEEERIAAMDDAEREAYFEGRALQSVFDDVRLRSRGGELTTPDYWESAGLAPEHMDAAAFTALVFDTIIDAQAKSQERRAAADSGIQAVDEAEAAAAYDADAASGLDASDDDAWRLDDIAVLEGSAVYLYSTDEMSESFARWAFLAAENDDVATLVENARHESKVYPRPLKAKSLTNRPVYMTEERIAAAFEAAQGSGLYPDIKTCSASNGDVYFYSTDFLSDAQAKALAEWESVERRANM